MPKYTVDEVLDIIKSLTIEEMKLLQAHLLEVLNSNSPPPSQGIKNQSQSFGDVSISGTANALSALQAQGNVSFSQANSQASVQNPDLKAALSLIEQLKQDINNSEKLNLVDKETIKVPINVVEEELKKSEPNKNLVDQAIANLKKALEGIQELAKPTMEVAALVAKAWLIL